MSNSATKKKKALSGSTMGMRFMQRNANATSETRTKTAAAKNFSPKHDKNNNNNAGGGEDRDDYDDCEWEIKNGQHNDSSKSTSAMDVDAPNSTAAITQH